MSRRALALALWVAAVCMGCRGPAEIETIQLQPPLPSEEPARPEPDDAWRVLTEATPLEKAEGTRYYSAEQAPRCPDIKVDTVLGNRLELEPGKRGFAEPGYVTLVVFWTVETRQGKAVARHVSDLVQKYRQWSVRAVGIVERTPRAQAAESFADQQRLAFSLYYDDLSALEKMAGRMDAEEERAVPAVFIIDRKMRLRFYRPGFRFAAGAFDVRRPGAEIIWESAPAGQAIEDYLKSILSEG
jgi:peroxiredoxin